MEKVHFPKFGTGTEILTGPDTSFREFGYFSTEVEATRWSRNAQHKPAMEAVKAAVAATNADTRLLFGRELNDDEWIPIFLRQRMLEACQGAAMLADRGMLPSAAAVLRTAWECMFYCCAIWENPAIADRHIVQSHRDMTRTAKRILDAYKKEDFAPGVWAGMSAEALHPDPDPGGPGLTIAQAAEEAKMQKVYASVFATLSKWGTHATGYSLSHYIPMGPPEGKDWIIKPTFEHIEILLRGAVICMQQMQDRFRKRFSDLTFGPPIQ